MTFKNKTAQKCFVLLLMPLLAMLALTGCEPGSDEDVPATVTTTSLDVGVETTVVVEATPGGAEEVGIDETVPAQDPLLPVTGTPTTAAGEEPAAEETQTPPATVETPAAFPEAVAGEMRTVIRFTDLVDKAAATGTGETAGQVVGILVDNQSTQPIILLDIRALMGSESQVVAVEANLFEATSEGEESLLFYLGATDYLQSLPPLDVTQWPEDSVVLSSADVDVAAESDWLLWIDNEATLAGLAVVNAQGEELGELQDLIIDLSNGQVLYGIVNVGGFLGIGENSVAIPWQQVQLDEAEERLVVDVETETLENAPTLDLEGWEAPTDPDWDADIRQFWQQTN